MKKLYARIGEDASDDRKQTLKDHIEGVARRSIKFAPTGFEACQELFALLHDLGKSSNDWQDYLFGKSGDMVPHSVHGAFYIMTYTSGLTKEEKTVGHYFLKEISMLVVRAHHGLIDALDLSGGHFEEKLDESFHKKYWETHQDAKDNFFKIVDEDRVKDLIDKAAKELESFLYAMYSLLDEEDNYNFYIGILSRMFLSVLIDSDWSDAASFFSRDEADWDDFMEGFSWDRMIENLEENLAGFKADSSLNTLRAEISEKCLESSDLEPGIYRLNVPTGGAKTLSVMRFALNHAKKYGKERIIYTAPFKSILDQTVGVYQESLLKMEEGYESLILEHHSDVVLERDGGNSEKNARIDYLMGNWASPVILTTSVQLLLTMFSAKKASIRRFHRLKNSVIIVDEFQSIPTTSMALFNSGINALAEFFGTTAILCTATQPPFEEGIIQQYGTKEIPKIRFSGEGDLTRDYSKEAGFKRTNIVNKLTHNPLTLEEVADLVLERASTEDSLLVVLNTRKAVSDLYDYLKKEALGHNLVCLSNDMYPAHRRKKIQEVRDALAEGEKLVVISTALIEAGVDLSFAGVIRSLASLDSIIQAGGRCNRHGEVDIGEVWIVEIDKDLENVSRLEDIVVAQDVMRTLLNNFERNPDQYDGDLGSQKAIRAYFVRFFEKVASKTHYPFTPLGHVSGNNKKAPSTSVYEVLGNNSPGRATYSNYQGHTSGHILNQALKTGGLAYQPIDSQAINLLVDDHPKAKDLIGILNSDSSSPLEKSQALRQVDRYSVGVFQYRLDELKGLGALYEIEMEGGGIWVLRQDFYSDEKGLENEKSNFESQML